MAVWSCALSSLSSHRERKGWLFLFLLLQSCFMSFACSCFLPKYVLDPWLLRSKSPVGNPQLIQFSREVIDLLKNQPSCVIPISNFIPSYHHHFAKQCRVSDYGYSKLIELLEAVPHVLQVRSAESSFV